MNKTNLSKVATSTSESKSTYKCTKCGGSSVVIENTNVRICEKCSNTVITPIKKVRR